MSFVLMIHQIFYILDCILQELEQIEIRKMIIDRMVHLLCVGHVIPVIQYMRHCLDNETADKSLIRYFAAEVKACVHISNSFLIVHSCVCVCRLCLKFKCTNTDTLYILQGGEMAKVPTTKKSKIRHFSP